jgi:hypothetical protein
MDGRRRLFVLLIHVDRSDYASLLVEVLDVQVMQFLPSQKVSVTGPDEPYRWTHGWAMKKDFVAGEKNVDLFQRQLGGFRIEEVHCRHVQESVPDSISGPECGSTHQAES